jgi:hypothetical protein
VDYGKLLSRERLVLVDYSIPEELNVRPGVPDVSPVCHRCVTDVSKIILLRFLFFTTLSAEGSLVTIETDRPTRSAVNS